ncbi:MAG: substrate-binding domain-containing protein [Planctomycetes bacterium]|nr:substrate-binding domain-containing protein [Planctomycetota bacterium]
MKRFLLLAAVLTAGCGAEKPRELILATTTSVQDTGLLGELLPAFQAKTGIAVKPVAVGSGEAIAMARRGEADVVLAHSPKDEEALVAEGFAMERRILMRNFFRVVGPAADPAGVAKAASAVEAFRAMAKAEAAFVTRGDQSGTHKRELAVWAKAGGVPAGARYVRGGAGMGETLRIADEKRAYTLCDESTYEAQKSKLSLVVLFAAEEADLQNTYSVLVLNATRLPKINAAGGRAFADFVAGPEGRKILGEFGKAKFGRPLFTLEPAQ